MCWVIAAIKSQGVKTSKLRPIFSSLRELPMGDRSERSEHHFFGKLRTLWMPRIQFKKPSKFAQTAYLGLLGRLRAKT